MVFATQKMDEFLTANYTTEETIKSALKFLPKVTLDEKLELANTSLIKECQPAPGAYSQYQTGGKE